MSNEIVPRGIRAKKNKNGTVSYEVRTTDANGRQHSRSEPTLPAAIRYQARYYADRQKGAIGDASLQRTKFIDWLPTWHNARTEIKPSTRAAVVTYVSCHLVPKFGSRRLSTIKPTEISTWMGEMTAQGLSPATVAKARQILSSIMNAAVRDGIIGDNPVRHTKPPKVVREEARFLSSTEVRQIELAMDPWWSLTVPFLADTGLRIGELAGLRVGDLSIFVESRKAGGREEKVTPGAAEGRKVLGGEIRVRRTASEISRKYTGSTTRRHVTSTKTNAGDRRVPTITAPVAQRLVDQIAQRGLTGDAPLFGGRRGAPMSASNWRRRAWDVAVDAADLEGERPTPHAMRHTAVALWIATGTATMFEMSTWAGHRGTKMIEMVYGHVMEKSSAGTRQALDEARLAAERDAAMEDDKDLADFELELELEADDEVDDDDGTAGRLTLVR